MLAELSHFLAVVLAVIACTSEPRYTSPFSPAQSHLESLPLVCLQIDHHRSHFHQPLSPAPFASPISTYCFITAQ